MHTSVQPSSTSNVIPFPTDLPPNDAKALSAIERFINDPPDNSRVYFITPAMAAFLLEKYNLDNRPTKPTKIGDYARDMGKQEWRLTGDTIKFSDRGILRDGQNRLLASVESGAAFQTHVVFGIDDAFFAVMDSGKNRDGSDLLAIAGVPNSRIVAAAVRWAHMLETDTVKLRTTLQAKEILRLHEERYHGVDQFVPYGRAAYATHKWPAGFIIGSLYHLSKIDPKAANDFGHAIANSNFSGRYSPLDKMRIELAGIASKSFGRVHDTVRAALLIIAWNLIRMGKKGSQKDFANWRDSDPFPKAK